MKISYIKGLITETDCRILKLEMNATQLSAQFHSFYRPFYFNSNINKLFYYLYETSPLSWLFDETKLFIT